jgi:hypothetical protein
MLEVSAADIEPRDGKVMVKRVPEKYITLQQIAANSMRFGRGRSANRASSPMLAAHLAKVAVDPANSENAMVIGNSPPNVLSSSSFGQNEHFFSALCGVCCLT